MPDIWGQTLDPIGVNQTQTTNLSRLAEVIFVKKIRNVPIAGLNAEADSVEAKKKFAEFIANGLMVENIELRNRDGFLNTAIQDVLGEYRNIYYQITTGASVNTPVDPGTGLSLLPNQDVSMITIDSTVLGSSTAQLTVRNPQNKYVHQQHPMYLGQAIFESDDVVYINLPGLDGNIYRAFTGFVTTVTIDAQVGDTINNTIVIECEDMLKRLRESRTNMKVGYIPAEARQTVSAYDISYANELPHQILARIFAAAYCDFESVPGVYDQLATARALAVTSAGADAAALQEFNILTNLTQLPVGQTQESFSGGALSLQPNPNALFSVTTTPNSPFMVTSGTVTVAAGQLVGTAQTQTSTSTTSVNNLPVTTTTSTNIPRQIFGFSQAAPTNLDAFSAAVSGSVTVNGLAKFPISNLAFIIEGTAQPVYALSFNTFGIERWISEWKSSADVAREIASAVSFELYTTPEGVLVFRPQNILLPADVSAGTASNQIPASQQPRVGTEYWLDRNFIKHESYTNSDRDIYTIATTLGLYDMPALNSGLEFIKAGIAVDALQYQKLGARLAPMQQKLELTDKDACVAYSRAYLNRLNSKARRGSVDYMGDARLRVGNPCYIPHRNQIYYIESITHQFAAGKSYTMTLSLNNGRVPVSIATLQDAEQLALTISNPDLVSDLQARYLFDPTLKRLGPSDGLGILDPLTGLYTNTSDEVTRYQEHGPTPAELGQFGVTAGLAGPALPVTGSAGFVGPSNVSNSASSAVIGDGQLVFNGYVWEDIQVMTYEDLASDLKKSTPTIYLSKLLLDFQLQSRGTRSLLQNYQQRNPTTALPTLQLSLLTATAKYVASSLVPDGMMQSQVAVSTPSGIV